MTYEGQEPLDPNTSAASLIETGDAEEVQMLLGHKDRLRCGGVVRTGVKVPRSNCTDAEKKKFAELEAQGMGYDQIDEALGGKPRSAQSKLIPRNADFFVVRDGDFTRPADAQYIREKFADADGKVRTIPVWLSVGEIDRVLHHGFRAFNGADSLVAASFYEGKYLKVKYLPADFKGGAKREDWLVAPFDPEKDVDSKGKPKSPAGHKMYFGGIFRFSVPGLKGFDEIVCVTRSWYGISYSVALLRRVRSVLKRFDGLLNGQPFLQLSKVAEEITYEGKRQTQYIPVLELAVDPMLLAQYAEPLAVADRASRAKAALTGGAFSSIQPMGAPFTPDGDLSSGTAPETVAPEGGSVADDAPFGNDDPERTVTIEALHAAAKWLGVTWEQFATWAMLDFTGGEMVDDAKTADLIKLLEHVRAEARADKTRPANETKFSDTVIAKAAAHGVGG